MLSDPITNIKGIGPRRAELLGKLGLVSLRDLLYCLPRGYRDYRTCTPIAACTAGMDAAVSVTLMAEPRLARVRQGLNILTVPACDEAGARIQLVWYNQPYRKAHMHAGMRAVACGRVDAARGIKLINPTLYAAAPGILPVYPLVQGLSQSVMRETVRRALAACGEDMRDTLPEILRARYALAPLPTALAGIHFPPDMETMQMARRRLAFEDMLDFRLMLDLLRQNTRPEQGISFLTDAATFCKKLPFTPTNAQMRVMGEIAADMKKTRPMNRLVQGDVGSGKTVLALFAMDTAVQNGYQAVLMAPTEILAVQHYKALQALFGPRAALLHGGMKKAEREAVLASIRTGETVAVVGTHALLQADVAYANLGVVIADEQHRFGVRQRAALRQRGVPDVLIMSATPIPRTLALLLYGDLDMSVLDELPPGRKPIKTHMVPPQRAGAMYAFIVEQVRAGRQAYIVCPLVDASEALEEALSAKTLYQTLREKLPVRLGLLHGQMKNVEKTNTINAFGNGEIDVLIATTVIEVGVDVPNATVMVVENADRFGLAQLHQLRGRVGRGGAESYCFLRSDVVSGEACERLKTLTQTQDGFAIAQKDLAMRGPGELLGTAQHGLGAFAAMALAADMGVLTDAQQAAAQIWADPALQSACAYSIDRARANLAAQLESIALN